MTDFCQQECGPAPTIMSLLRTRAKWQPDDVGYAFVSDRGAEQITYAELDRRARIVAWLLADLHVDGQPVLLVYPPGVDYLAAFFGCLYAGAIAVPVPAPDPSRPDGSQSHLAAVARDATPCLTLSTTAVGADLSSLSGSAPRLCLPPVVSVGDVPARWYPDWAPGPVDAESPALLQYTPARRGTVFTHRSLVSGSELVFCLSGHTRDSRGVICLPPYYGMGLFEGIIQPLYGGFPMTLMAPDDFLRQPVRWLREISRTRATTSGAPNYVYDLCVERITAEESRDLDLSSWQTAFNGSEQVQAETMENFVQAFEPAGFRREAFHPCYGFTEDALMVTGGIPWSRRTTKYFDAPALRLGRAVPAEADGESCCLVSYGYASVDHCRVAIVDPMTRIECPEGRVGEIWMAGTSVARSYWRKPEQSREVLAPQLAGTADGPFVRTGDLGFVLDHELYVTGKINDAADLGPDRMSLAPPPEVTGFVRHYRWIGGSRADGSSRPGPGSATPEDAPAISEDACACVDPGRSGRTNRVAR